jgi:hypothetical protein
MSDVTATVDTYLAMWTETDTARRAAHIGRAWARDGRYVDPMLEAEGHAALDEMVRGVQARFPGHRFTRVSAVDAHHGELRFGWQLAAPDGAVVVAGVDVGEVAPDGRLRRITGSSASFPRRPRPDARGPGPAAAQPGEMNGSNQRRSASCGASSTRERSASSSVARRGGA